MKNKIINLALKQIESEDKNKLMDMDLFFREYSEVFNKNNLFNKCVIKNTSLINKSNIINISNLLIQVFKSTINKLLKFDLKVNVGLIIFIGDSKVDAHGIIIDGLPYVFVDLAALVPNINTYDIDAFMLHETIHAIHYDLNKELYPKNHNSIEDKYLKRLICEGLATYLSMDLSNISMESAYWMGFLEHHEVKEWIYNCENEKLNIGMNLRETIKSNEFNKDIYNKLFCVLKFERITSYRMGYYYGSQIVKTIKNEKSLQEILMLKFTKIKEYIYEYFNS